MKLILPIIALVVVFAPQIRQKPLLSVREESISVGDSTVRVLITEGENNLPYVFCALHESERTSVKAAKRFMTTQNAGKLYELKAQGKRMMQFRIGKKTFEADPNRIFTPDGARKTLVERGRMTGTAVQTLYDFSQALVDKIVENSTTIVSLHNSTDGSFSIESYLAGQTYAQNAEEVFIAPGQDTDDFFFVTERTLFEKIKAKNYNVILQNNTVTEDDGSLSVYCSQKNYRYVNVEAENGHISQQIEMLVAIHQILLEE